MALIPHRPPFLLVDKITELTEDRVVGVKSVTMNEPFCWAFPNCTSYAWSSPSRSYGTMRRNSP